MVAMNDTDEDNDMGKEAFFLENEKIHKDSEPLERERTHEYPDSDQEGLEYMTEGGGSPSPSPSPSPAEIKLKIKKALLEFRCRVEDAILGNYLLGKTNKKLPSKEKFKAKQFFRDITLWGVPLLPSKSHEGTDIILMKFLKAKDFKVHDAFDMLRKTMKWRKENKIDGILNEDLDSDFGNVIYLNSRDREGRPVFYTDYGAFKDQQFYGKTSDTEEKYQQFLRWRIQLMEKGIMKLNLKGGVDSMIQIIDLKNAPRQGMKELNSVTKRALVLIHNHYPELIHRHIVINAPFWFYTSHVLLSRLLSQRSKKKFIFARRAQATQTLLKLIAPEHLPVEYGGLKRDKDEDFSPADKASELVIKGSAVASVEFPVKKAGVTVMWDVTVVGWEVSYKEEFIPDDEGSYRILLQNQKKTGESSRNSFHISEPGKIVITVDNGSYKKKRMFYRSKTGPTVPMFVFFK